MKKRITCALVVTGLVAGWYGTLTAEPRPGRSRATAAPVVAESLLLALAGPEGEYSAYADYDAILRRHGRVQPYVWIQQAESRHIAALKRQLEKYGLTVPPNRYLGATTAPARLEDAAAEAIASEEGNVAMYDRLLAKLTDYPDLTRVFEHLQHCSREMHLPTLREAAAHDGKVQASQVPPCGQGKGMGCPNCGCGRRRGR